LGPPPAQAPSRHGSPSQHCVSSVQCCPPARHCPALFWQYAFSPSITQCFVQHSLSVVHVRPRSGQSPLVPAFCDDEQATTAARANESESAMRRVMVTVSS
jgi:hypothetical protein